MGDGRIELWRTVPEGARELPPGGVCPKCRSPRVHRSRAKGAVEQLRRALGPWRPFACQACRWRGWRWPETGEGPVHDLPPALPERRRRHRSRGEHSKSAPRPRGRLGRQLVIALVLACAMGGAFVYCQQAPPLVLDDH